MIRLNRVTYQRALEVIGLPEDIGDGHRFTMTFKQVCKLLAEYLIGEDERQNEGPTVKELHTFVIKHNLQMSVIFEAYIIKPHRSDSRVTIEGARFIGVDNVEVVKDIIREYRQADEFDIDSDGTIRVWWD